MSHSTNRTNRSNRQRWTAGSVVSNEMRVSDWQHQGFGSCLFDESDESIDSTGFIASLQLMTCNFRSTTNRKFSFPMESTWQYWTCMDKIDGWLASPQMEQQRQRKNKVKPDGWPAKILNTLCEVRKLTHKSDGGKSQESENRPGKRSYAQRSKRKDQKDAAYPG